MQKKFQKWLSFFLLIKCIKGISINEIQDVQRSETVSLWYFGITQIRKTFLSSSEPIEALIEQQCLRLLSLQKKNDPLIWNSIWVGFSELKSFKLIIWVKEKNKRIVYSVIDILFCISVWYQDCLVINIWAKNKYGYNSHSYPTFQSISMLPWYLDVDKTCF